MNLQILVQTAGTGIVRSCRTGKMNIGYLPLRMDELCRRHKEHLTKRHLPGMSQKFDVWASLFVPFGTYCKKCPSFVLLASIRCLRAVSTSHCSICLEHNSDTAGFVVGCKARTDSWMTQLELESHQIQRILMHQVESTLRRE